MFGKQYFQKIKKGKKKYMDEKHELKKCTMETGEKNYLGSAV